jgi:hypothetical protein
MKYKYISISAVISGLLYIMLIFFNFPFLNTTLFYKAFDLNELFYNPIISYSVWTMMWMCFGALSGYGFYAKNKFLSYTPILIFSIINIFSQLILTIMLYFVCSGGCVIW